MKKTRVSVAKALDLIPGHRWSRASAWLWLNSAADDQGRVGVSSKRLADIFGWSRATTRRFLLQIEECGLIIRDPRDGHSEAIATLCGGKEFPTVEESCGHPTQEIVPAARSIRAPTAPDKRLAFFAKMIIGPDAVPEGAVSPIMAQALIASGAVTPEALRKKGIIA